MCHATVVMVIVYVTVVSGIVNQRLVMLSVHPLEILTIRHLMVRDTTSMDTAVITSYRDLDMRSKLRTSNADEVRLT